MDGPSADQHDVLDFGETPYTALIAHRAVVQYALHLHGYTKAFASRTYHRFPLSDVQIFQGISVADPVQSAGPSTRVLDSVWTTSMHALHYLSLIAAGEELNDPDHDIPDLIAPYLVPIVSISLMGFVRFLAYTIACQDHCSTQAWLQPGVT